MVKHNMHWGVGGRDGGVYPDWNDFASRVRFTMSEQAASTNLGSITIPGGAVGKTFHIDTIILNNESAALEAQVIFTLTSTSSTPIFAVRVPMKDTVVITGLIGMHTSTASVLFYQMGNTNVMSTGGSVGGWLLDTVEYDYRTSTRATRVH